MVVGLALALALGGALPDPPVGSLGNWSQPNGDATYVARQTGQNGQCHLQVIHDADQSVLWERDGCYGGKADKEFLSRDGQRLIVLATFPAASGKQAAGWSNSTVAWLFDRGTVVSSGKAGQFVKDGSHVRREVSHFSWLQGANGVPGVPPHLNDASDAVELDAIDGTHAVLAFDGFKLRPMPSTRKHKAKHRRH